MDMNNESKIVCIANIIVVVRFWKIVIEIVIYKAYEIIIDKFLKLLIISSIQIDDDVIPKIICYGSQNI